MTAICAVKYFNQTSNETYFAKGLRFTPTEAIEFSIAQAPLIVFITVYNKHAVSAFEIFALDYLLKPFDDERFAAMLARAKQALQTNQPLLQSAVTQDYFLDRDAEKSGATTPHLTHVTVRSAGKVERIDISDIVWLSTAANYVKLHLPNRIILHRTTISAMEERLP